MELKDLVEGKTYYVEYDKSKWCVIKASNGDFRDVPGYYFECNLFHFLSRNHWSCKNNIRIATHKEKLHLEACIKANKYVECPAIEENVLNSIQIW